MYRVLLPLPLTPTQQYINKRIIISKGIISTLCIEALVQSRIFIHFCYEQNIEFVFARFPCIHNQINLFMAEISQFNLHFNAFAHYFAGTKTVYMAFVSTLLLSLIFTDLCSFFVCMNVCVNIMCPTERFFVRHPVHECKWWSFIYSSTITTTTTQSKSLYFVCTLSHQARLNHGIHK